MMKVSGDFRKIALIVILLRAGFELRRDALRRFDAQTVPQLVKAAEYVDHRHQFEDGFVIQLQLPHRGSMQ